MILATSSFLREMGERERRNLREAIVPWDGVQKGRVCCDPGYTRGQCGDVSVVSVVSNDQQQSSVTRTMRV